MRLMVRLMSQLREFARATSQKPVMFALLALSQKS